MFFKNSLKEGKINIVLNGGYKFKLPFRRKSI
jgi:hypothetical protein